MRKRAFWICLTVLVLTLFLVLPAGAEEVTHSGTCGENITWRFDETSGTLTLSGSGPMADYDEGFWTNKSYRDSITHVVVERGITTIGKYAFGYLEKAVDIQLPDTITRIGDCAFAGCWRLTGIQIPNSVQYIGKRTFISCSALTSIVLPDGVTECGPETFRSCTGLTSVTLPASLQKLPYGMFYECSRMTTLTVPAGVKEVENGAFGKRCTINAIIFKGNAPVFGESAFEEITAVVRYPANNSTWTEDKQQNYAGTITWVADSGTSLSGTFGKNKMTWKLENGTLTITGDGYLGGWSTQPPWYLFRSMIKKAVFSGTIESIGKHTFLDCTELTEVVWAPTIAYVFERAFKGCTGLTSITIPDTVTNMYNGVFTGCTALQTVTLSNKLKELSRYTFYGCTSLKSVTIPASVYGVSIEVFMHSAVEAVYFQGNMPGFSKSSFDQGPFSAMGNATIYYAANNKSWTAEKIKEVEGWYRNGNIKFVATEELNKYTQHQQFVEDPKPSTGEDTGGNTPGNNSTDSNPDNNTDVVPDTPETSPQTTPSTENTENTQPETTNPVKPTDQTTTPTVAEDKNTAGKESSGAWIVWLVVGAVVAADTVIGVIYLKKRKNKNK